MLTVHTSANHKYLHTGTCRKTTYHIDNSAEPVILCLSPDFHISRWRGQWWSYRLDGCLSRNRRACFIICKREFVSVSPLDGWTPEGKTVFHMSRGRDSLLFQSNCFDSIALIIYIVLLHVWNVIYLFLFLLRELTIIR